MDEFIDEVFEAVDFSKSDIGEDDDSKNEEHEVVQLRNVSQC